MPNFYIKSNCKIKNYSKYFLYANLYFSIIITLLFNMACIRLLKSKYFYVFYM